MEKKRYLNVASLVAMMLVLVWASALGASSAHTAHIVVDTGHTPQRPGATGASGRVEYLYNLDVSAAVADELVALNHRVTRVSADGKEIELKRRAVQAPRADFFLSIHHDSIQQAWLDAGRQREFSGFSLFVSRRNPHYAQSLRCAQAIGEELLRCAQAIGEELLKAGEKPSLYHATPIPGENRPLIDSRLGIHRFDNLVVLRTAPMAAVLVEVGVIINPDEEKRLSEPGTISKLAAAIAQATHNCNVTL